MKFPLFLRKSHLKRCRQHWLVLRTACYVFSASEVAIEILSHFWTQFDTWTRGNLWMLLALVLSALLVGGASFVYRCAKMLSVSERLGETDIWIDLQVGDLFDTSGDLIIGTNTTFETSMANGFISEDSLQGQFTKRHYSNNVDHLDHDLDPQLEECTFVHLDDGRDGKTKRYDIGTIVALRPDGKVTYFVAVADLNKHGVAEGSLENVRISLGKLWHFIGERGELGALAIPVIGTGRARVHASKNEMIREIAKSFVAACSEKRFCRRLTIVVSEADYLDDEIDLLPLADYIRHLCQYVQIRRSIDAGEGNALG